MNAVWLTGLDLLLAVLVLVSWTACHAVFRAAVRGGAVWLPWALLPLATLLTMAAILVSVLLGRLGNGFGVEQIVFAVPILLLSAIPAVIMTARALLRFRPGGPERSAALTATPLAEITQIAAVAGAGAGLLGRFVIGYPEEMAPAAVLNVLVVAVVVIAWFHYLRPVPRLAIRAVAGVSTGLLVAALAWGWIGSRATSMTAAGHQHDHHARVPMGGQVDGNDQVSVTDLRTPNDARTPVTFTLTATETDVRLPSGRSVQAWSFGSVPGPEIRVQQGDLVEVTLVNRDVAIGVSLHWHGYHLPNGEDGVPGVTQDAVMPGQSFRYRFSADQVGTYWYHTHQSGVIGISKGLFGALVVLPAGGGLADTDLVLPVHVQDGVPILGVSDKVVQRRQPEDSTVRLRLINTDQLPRRVELRGTSFRVQAVDGVDLHGPQLVRDQVIRIPAGGRRDLTFTQPAGPVSLSAEVGSETGLVLSPSGSAPLMPFNASDPELDLLSYGTPTGADDLSGPVDVDERMILDRKFRFLEGKPVYGYTVNGAVYPSIDPVVVAEGDLLRVTTTNRSSDTHPMHPHGHHVLVESRNGVKSTGSPLWMDTFDVQPGEVWVVRMRADNPGIWMDHCHNLEHAKEGMMLHLAYRGVTTPFSHGGRSSNEPE